MFQNKRSVLTVVSKKTGFRIAKPGFQYETIIIPIDLIRKVKIAMACTGKSKPELYAKMIKEYLECHKSEMKI